MNNNVVEQIKERINIVDIVSKHVDLKKSGKNHFGLCPFHSEKSPSFSVNEDLGIYKCFGCGEAGDVISFVEKVENLDFKEALEMLGKIAGIEVDFSNLDSPEEKKRQRLFALNDFAKKFFQYFLLKNPAGSAGREYIKSRNLKLASIKEFGIGYAPSNRTKPDILAQYAIKKGFTKSELIEGGLCINKEGQTIDKFRERLMFTIYDAKGRVVGFSGRILIKSDYAPKYLNTPETPVFHKSEVLYGLFQGKEAIRKADNVILVEGQIDVISSHQAGVKNVTAPLGTSLTNEHLKALKRFTSNISICFDQDLAGEKAFKRAIQMAQTQDFEVTAIPVEGAKDVDELVQSDPKKWIEVAQSPSKIVEYFVDRLLARIDIKKVDGKVELIGEIAPYIISIPNQIKKDFYINELARKTDVDPDVVHKYLGKTVIDGANESIKKEITEHIKTNSSQSHETYFLGRMVQFPEIAFRIRHLLTPEIFANAVYRKFITDFIECVSEDDVKKLFKTLDPKDLALISDASMSNMDSDENIEKAEQDMLGVLSNMTERFYKRELRRLKSLTEQNPDDVATHEEINQMARKLAEIQRKRT